MRITKDILDAQVAAINRYTKRGEGERYYVGYENGGAHLFRECGGGRQTISYGNTKNELSKQMSTIIVILALEETKAE